MNTPLIPEHLSARQYKSLQSNLQKAQTKRAQKLMQEGQDFYKRQGGVNATHEEALHGDIDPALLLKQEKPVHRTMINMAVAGYQNTEIAAAVGRNHKTVANTLRQPWARDYIINQAKKTVQDEIREILEQQAIPSIKKLVETRDRPESRPADVISASNALLDRFLGKPTQPITTDAKPVSEMSEQELREQVQKELAASKAN